jgi:hypothetical protein
MRSIDKEVVMNRDLACFYRHWLRVVLMTLVPVVFTAFVTIPYNLGGNPGQVAVAPAPGEHHVS